MKIVRDERKMHFLCMESLLVNKEALQSLYLGVIKYNQPFDIWLVDNKRPGLLGPFHTAVSVLLSLSCVIFILFYIIIFQD